MTLPGSIRLRELPNTGVSNSKCLTCRRRRKKKKNEVTVTATATGMDKEKRQERMRLQINNNSTVAGRMRIRMPLRRITTTATAEAIKINGKTVDKITVDGRLLDRRMGGSIQIHGSNTNTINNSSNACLRLTLELEDDGPKMMRSFAHGRLRE